MKALKLELPLKWLSPSAKNSKPKATAPASRSVRAVGSPHSLTPKGKLIDVVLVIFWGASIPGVMWLAAAGGF